MFSRTGSRSVIVCIFSKNGCGATGAGVGNYLDVVLFFVPVFNELQCLRTDDGTSAVSEAVASGC